MSGDLHVFEINDEALQALAENERTDAIQTGLHEGGGSLVNGVSMNFQPSFRFYDWISNTVGDLEDQTLRRTLRSLLDGLIGETQPDDAYEELLDGGFVFSISPAGVKERLALSGTIDRDTLTAQVDALHPDAPERYAEDTAVAADVHGLLDD